MKNKRDLILDAAEEIIQTKRYHEVRIDDVAKTASVGKGTIYRYFQSKEDLFFSLAIRGFHIVQEELEKLLSSEMEYKQKLLCVSQAFLSFIVRRSTIYRIMREIEQRSEELKQNKKNEFMENRKITRDLIAQIMQKGLDLNLLNLNLSALQYAEFWIHSLVGISHWDNDVEPMELEQFINLHLKEKL